MISSVVILPSSLTARNLNQRPRQLFALYPSVNRIKFGLSYPNRIACCKHAAAQERNHSQYDNDLHLTGLPNTCRPRRPTRIKITSQLPNGAHGAPDGLQGFMPQIPKTNVRTYINQNQIPAPMLASYFVN